MKYIIALLVILNVVIYSYCINRDCFGGTKKEVIPSSAPGHYYDTVSYKDFDRYHIITNSDLNL